MRQGDPSFRASVEVVMRRVASAESTRAAEAGDQARSCVLRPQGDRLRLVVPTGYETFIEPLVREFGEKLIVEFADSWFAYAPIAERVDHPIPRP